MRLRTRRGRPILDLEAEERELLGVLFDELTALLDSADGTDEALRRLNPAAYREDPEAETEFRALTADSLRSERDDRITACRAELADNGHVDLGDPDAARRWLQVLNDLRLALGTRLGVTQDYDHDIDPSDASAQPWIVYTWLTALQDTVVHALLP